MNHMDTNPGDEHLCGICRKPVLEAENDPPGRGPRCFYCVNPDCSVGNPPHPDDVRRALTGLDGTEEARLAMLTGLTKDEIADLGGI